MIVAALHNSQFTFRALKENETQSHPVALGSRVEHGYRLTDIGNIFDQHT